MLPLCSWHRRHRLPRLCPDIKVQQVIATGQADPGKADVTSAAKDRSGMVTLESGDQTNAKWTNGGN